MITGMDSTPSGREEENAGTEPDVRFTYANERTFLAWIRTSLGLVTAGLAITQLLPPFDVPGGRRLIGLPLIALGTVTAFLSYRHWQENDRAMRERKPLPRSPMPRILAVVVSVSAAIAFLLAAFSDRR